MCIDASGRRFADRCFWSLLCTILLVGFAISDSLRLTKRCSFLVDRSWWFLPKWCPPPGPSIPRRSPNCRDAIHLSTPVQSPLHGRVGGARMTYHRLPAGAITDYLQEVHAEAPIWWGSVQQSSRCCYPRPSVTDSATNPYAAPNTPMAIPVGDDFSRFG